MSAEREPPAAVAVRPQRRRPGAGSRISTPSRIAASASAASLARRVRTHLDQRDLPQMQPDVAARAARRPCPSGRATRRPRGNVKSASRCGAPSVASPSYCASRKAVKVLSSLHASITTDADRDVVLAVQVHLPHDLGLRVPLVAAGPQPEHPVGQLLGAPDLGEERRRAPRAACRRRARRSSVAVAPPSLGLDPRAGRRRRRRRRTRRDATCARGSPSREPPPTTWANGIGR